MASGGSSLFCVAGKNVLITGGSRGIGYMIASTFVERGANVLITSRDSRACESAASDLLSLPRPPPLSPLYPSPLPPTTSHGMSSESKSSPPSSASTSTYVHHVQSNVSTREGCKELANHVRRIFDGRLDVLVNNAGTSWGEDPGYDMNGRESGKMNWGWDKVLDLNVKGMFYLTRECVPMLQRRRVDGDCAEEDGNETTYYSSSYSSSHSSYSSHRRGVDDPGRIINVGSVTGLMPQDAPTHAYDVSKAAVHHLTKKFAADLAPRGITVNAIAPGYVLTRMSKGLLSTWSSTKTTTKEEEEGGRREMGHNLGKNVDNNGGMGMERGESMDGGLGGMMPIPLGRMGNTEDMGGACIYLSSRAGSWITGVILTVDGGLVGAAKIPLSNL
ncbi:hypothetical protein ACHAXA_010581 [Cyclostephanos tholiformis]|uniref:NAD(P)-binding protein n=1 Tax=Cyclostephanos tholiformis TaxID=382380 RepID=A0ABD3RZD6_9STRA